MNIFQEYKVISDGKEITIKIRISEIANILYQLNLLTEKKEEEAKKILYELKNNKTIKRFN